MAREAALREQKPWKPVWAVLEPGWVSWCGSHREQGWLWVMPEAFSFDQGGMSGALQAWPVTVPSRSGRERERLLPRRLGHTVYYKKA